jgi:hypothetical protein
MKTNTRILIAAIIGFLGGAMLGFGWDYNKEPDADRLIRLKAEMTAYEAKNTIHQWEWEDFVKMKGEIAVLESRTNNLERK